MIPDEMVEAARQEARRRGLGAAQTSAFVKGATVGAGEVVDTPTSRVWIEEGRTWARRHAAERREAGDLSGPTDARPTDTRPTDTRPTDTRPTDTRPTDTRPTDTRPTDTRPTDTRPTDTRPTDTGARGGARAGAQATDARFRTAEQRFKLRLPVGVLAHEISRPLTPDVVADVHALSMAVATMTAPEPSDGVREILSKPLADEDEIVVAWDVETDARR